MDFQIKLNAARFLLPILCSGILVSGIALFTYIYHRSRKPLYRSMVIVNIMAFLFVSGEALLLVTGGWLHMDSLGMQFHRLSQVGGAFFIFGIPLLLDNLVEINESWKKANRVVMYMGLAFALFILIAALAEPDLFVSLTVHKKSWLINEGDFGRGREGILYFMRDIILGLMSLYCLVIIIIDLRMNKNFRFLLLPLIGISISIFSAADDIINIHAGFHIGLFPNTDYSRFTLGITFFMIMIMATLVRNFIDLASETETARQELLEEIAHREAAEREREKIKEQLYQSQKLEAVGLLAGGIAHDFNNLLTAIIGSSSLLKTEIGSSDDDMSRECLQYADQIQTISEKAAALTKHLLIFSRHQKINPVTVDLNKIIRHLEKLLVRVIGENINLTINTCSDDLFILADEGTMEQVLINLVNNARDAMPEGGSLVIETGIRSADLISRELNLSSPQGSYAYFSIEDSGTGIESSILNKIFEPFFTTKDVGKGTGLGLAIVFGIVKQHKGYISAKSTEGKGSKFTVYIPLTDTKPIAVNAPLRDHLPAGGDETILLIEDDPDVQKIISTILKQSGYTLITAANGEDGLVKFNDNSSSIDLVITDVILPKLNGREVYNEVIKIKPQMKTIFISGYSADIIDEKIVKTDKTHYLKKPFLPENLLKKIRDVIDS